MAGYAIKERSQMEGVIAVVRSYSPATGKPLAYFTDHDGKERVVELGGRNDVKRFDRIMVKGKNWAKV
jgi:hypothetical protein